MIPPHAWLDILSRSDWSTLDIIIAVQRDTLECAARRCESRDLRSAAASNAPWDAARRTCAAEIRCMKPPSMRDELALLAKEPS